jgi:hypothetical protein
MKPNFKARSRKELKAYVLDIDNYPELVEKICQDGRS